MDEVCLFCSESLNRQNKPACTVSRGPKSIISKSIEYELHKKLTNISSINVHVECRKKYTRPGSNKGKQSVEESASVVLRSVVQEFNFRTHCFFCGEEASTRLEKNKGAKLRREIYEFRTIEIRDKVIVRAQERKDQWGDVVLA